MIDGRLDPEFCRFLAEGRVSASELSGDLHDLGAEPADVDPRLVAVVTAIALVTAVAVSAFCAMQFT